MSNKEKWVDLGDITPHFRLEGKKLQIQYPEEDWQDLADFSDVATTLELRLNEETNAVEVMQSNGEWAMLLDLSKVGGGIKTVQTYRDLPADAKEGDVCLVLEDGYGEDDWQPYKIDTSIIEHVKYLNFDEIKFHDTFEETLEATGLGDAYDNLVSGIQMFGAFGDNANLQMIAFCAKMDGMNAVGVMIMQENYDTGEMTIYILSDNSDFVAMMMLGTEGMSLPNNVWVKLETVYTETEDGEDYEMSLSVTELEEAPKFSSVQVLVSTFSNDKTDYGYKSKFGFYSYPHSECWGMEEGVIIFNPVKIAFMNRNLSFFQVNNATVKKRGLYFFNENKWEFADEEKHNEPTIFECEDIQNDFLYNAWSDIVPQEPKDGELFTAKAPKRIFSGGGNGGYGQFRFTLNGAETQGRTSEMLLKRSLPQIVPDAFLSTLDNKTILWNFQPYVDGGTYDCYIAVKDGVMIVGNDGEILCVYNSVPNNRVNFAETFSDLFDSESSSMPAIMDMEQTGWYIYCTYYDGGAICFKDIYYDDRFFGANDPLYLADGITNKITGNQGNTVSFDSIFGYEITSSGGTSVFGYAVKHDGVDVCFTIKYSELFGWELYTPFNNTLSERMKHYHTNQQYLDEINRPLIEKLKNAEEYEYAYVRNGEFERFAKTSDLSFDGSCSTAYNLADGFYRTNVGSYNGAVIPENNATYKRYCHFIDNCTHFDFISVDPVAMVDYINLTDHITEFKNMTAENQRAVFPFIEKHLEGISDASSLFKDGFTVNPFEDFTKASTIENLFKGSQKLRAAYIRVSADTNMSYAFERCPALGGVVIHVIDPSDTGVINTSQMKDIFGTGSYNDTSVKYFYIGKGGSDSTKGQACTEKLEQARIKVDCDWCLKGLSWSSSETFERYIKWLLGSIVSNAGEETTHTITLSRGVQYYVKQETINELTEKNITLKFE